MRPRVALCLFAKPPRAGAVKTRLAAEVGEPAAAALAAAFLEDTWAAACALGWAAPVLVTTELDEGLRAVAGGHALWLQGDGDLGARLERVLQRALGLGAPAIALGADSPGLPPQRLEQIRSGLAEHDAVIGPADDGGFYALGVRRCPGGMLADLPWSSGQTCEATAARLRQLGMSVGFADPWFDVDRPADLLRLHGLIARGEVSAPATARALAALRT